MTQLLCTHPDLSLSKLTSQLVCLDRYAGFIDCLESPDIKGIIDAVKSELQLAIRALALCQRSVLCESAGGQMFSRAELKRQRPYFAASCLPFSRDFDRKLLQNQHPETKGTITKSIILCAVKKS